MQFIPTALQDVVLITPRTSKDVRGTFVVVYSAEKFNREGIDAIFVQDNYSLSKQGVLRGLHYQYKRPQGKLIWVPHGIIFDVAIDLRRSSTNFGRSHTVILSGRNKHQLWIPPGYAHGYYVLSKSAYVFYKTTDYYDPASECTILWNDPELSIPWPLIKDRQPVLSHKDEAGSYFKDSLLFE